MRLTSGHRDRAEELVQDAFIQFTSTSPCLEDVQNLDAYLHGVLRKLHLSQARRAARAPEVPLDAVDYDLVDWSLREADARAQRHVLEELSAVCAYACERRHSSKAGSVLILRFFHGYYPAEIGRILRIDVRAVDEWRRIARREAKAAIAAQARSHPQLHTRVSAANIAELRAAIFAARSGPCLTPAQLNMYGAAPLRQRIGKVLPLPRTSVRAKSEIDSTVAAHIVSCERCLDRICQRLGIPLLSERCADEHVGPGSRQDPPGPPNSRGGSSTSDVLRRARRRSQQTFEHRPDQLHIAVNGLPLAWQSIGAEPVDQYLNVTTHEPIEFVEVFSEQGVRLLFLNARPPADDTPVQRTEVMLSGGRRLGVQISFAGTWPTIHLTYVDPIDTAAHDAATHRTTSDGLADESLGAAGPYRRRWRLAFVVALVMAVSAAVWAEPVRSALRDAVQQIDRVVHEWLHKKPGEVRRGADSRNQGTASSARELIAPIARTPARTSSTRSSTFEKLAALEIDVLGRLDGVGALLGERVTVSRNDQRVLVEAMAESAARKSEIRAALASLMTAPDLQVRIRTVSEGLRGSARIRRESVAVREVQVSQDGFPARQIVHEYFRLHGAPDSALANRTREFASRIVDRSGGAVAHTWALQRLVNRFSAEEQRALPAATYAAWARLVEGHARQVGELTASLRQELASVFQLPPPDSPVAPELNGPAASSIPETVEALVVAVSAHNQAIRAAFTAHDEPAERDVVIDEAFLQSMREVEGLVDRLAHQRQP